MTEETQKSETNEANVQEVVETKEVESPEAGKSTEKESVVTETATENNKKEKTRRRFKEEKIDRSELLKDINIDELNLSDIKAEIRTRRNKRSEILKKLKELSTVRNEFKESRNELNSEASSSFQKVQEIKIKRNEVNKEIKEIKNIREGILLELKQLSNREKEIIGILKESSEPGSKRGNSKRINKDIEQLEWKLQTTPNLNRNEEKFLMDRIDELSSRLGAVENVEAIQKEIRDLRKFRSSLKVTLDDNWNRLNELVKTSQDRHNRISELYEKGKAAKEEADKKHQLLLTKIKETSNYRTTLRVINAELDILFPKFRSMKGDGKGLSGDFRDSKTSESIKNAKSTEIQKKLDNKKGLSISEMKFLMENRLINLKTDK